MCFSGPPVTFYKWAGGIFIAVCMVEHDHYLSKQFSCRFEKSGWSMINKMSLGIVTESHIISFFAAIYLPVE